MFQNDWVQFFQPTRVHLEHDSLHKLGSWVSSIGSRILLLKSEDTKTDHSSEIQILEESLKKQTKGSIIYDLLPGDPSIDDIDSAAYFARQSNADAVMIVGMREAINAGKAVALLATNRIFATEILKGETDFKYPALPIITLPLAPTMGEEMSDGFLLIEHNYQELSYIRNESIIPKACFYDPKLSIKISNKQASKITGSLISYCIESIISRKLNPFSETLLVQSLTYVKENSISFYKDPYKAEFSTNMFWASAFLGSCLSSAPMGITWAVARVLESFYDISFEYSLCILLPYVMEYYLASNPQIFINIAKVFDEDVTKLSKIEAAIKSIEGYRKILTKLDIPSSLTQINFDEHLIASVTELSLRLPHTKGLIKEIDRQSLESILLSAME